MRLGIKHLVTSIEHPQTNGHAKATNRVILRAQCTRVNKSKGLWKEELPIYSGPITTHPKQQPMKLLIDSHMA